MLKGFRWWWQQVGLGLSCRCCDPGVECSFWVSGWWDLTPSAWFDSELSGANPAPEVCTLAELGSWSKVGTEWLPTLKRKEVKLGACHCQPNLPLLPARAGGGSPALSQFWSSPISLFIRTNPGLAILRGVFGCSPGPALKG
uniref:Uncharacterized protein n=1 Tax=Falco tinnunculus TaxID=100819 RepID=A0A8C4V7Z0_FALTI